MTSQRARSRAAVPLNTEHRAPRASRVLAERNQAVVAVGAWVEEGQDFQEHPSALALLTEEIQAERRRVREESLRRFQDEVRHRVAQQAHISKRREQPQDVEPHEAWTRKECAGENLRSSREAAKQRKKGRVSQESVEGMRQVRLRLAACRTDPCGEVTSNLPGGEWKVSPGRHRPHMLRANQDMEEREEEDDVEEVEEEDDHIISTHKCPLVQQKVSGHVLWDSGKSSPHPEFQSSPRVPRVLWPPPDQEELKRQRQSQFLMHRRLYMNMEREQVKENDQHRKHLKRTARIKAEKEQIRLEEERRLERDRQLEEARQRLEERELLILERLRLEEKEVGRAVELQSRRREEKGKTGARFTEALRARMKERLSQTSVDLPPLCCCASSFWDSHPDTCANNCVFHNNHKEYAKVLNSTLMSLDLR